MKRIISIIVIAFCILSSGCEDDSTDNISKTTTYPIVSLNGLPVIAHPAGTPFVDPGAIGTVNDEPVELQIEGSVTDINTIGGTFIIAYTATNAEGYSRMVTRAVVIVDPATDATDLSGQYIRNATGVTATVTKVGPSVYYHTNVGGFAGTVLNAYFVHVQGTTLKIPIQTASASGVVVESRPGTAFTNAAGFQWAINAAGFSTGNRIWVKL